jgi:hypothetical protein
MSVLDVTPQFVLLSCREGEINIKEFPRKESSNNYFPFLYKIDITY